MKCKGRVKVVRSTMRPFTFALPVRLTAAVIPVVMNDELREMQAKRKNPPMRDIQEKATAS